jgi:hypothetical protein
MPTGETPEVLESTNPRARWYHSISFIKEDFIRAEPEEIAVKESGKKPLHCRRRHNSLFPGNGSYGLSEELFVVGMTKKSIDHK